MSENQSITYNKWGRMGRLGNKLFQLASLQGMSKRYNRNLYLPSPWTYQQYFNTPISHTMSIQVNEDDINEPHFHHSWEYWDDRFSIFKDKNTIGVSGWLQSYKYFSSREDVLKLFEFSDSFK